MPDKRAHRGPHPDDAALFSADAVARLRSAVADLSWLLSREYAEPSALKVVGDRYTLTARQRTAVMRAACSDSARGHRQRRALPADSLAGQTLLLDGYNVLTTIEAALGGGVLLRCRDGALRDMASMHGTYHGVDETVPALTLIGQTLAALGVREERWYLDSPVSNSGRLRATMRDVAERHGWPWQIELVMNPDPVLCQADDARTAVATADSVILDRCRRGWFNLVDEVVRRHVPAPWIIDLAQE